jgi:hypothetical protein
MNEGKNMKSIQALASCALALALGGSALGCSTDTEDGATTGDTAQPAGDAAAGEGASGDADAGEATAPDNAADAGSNDPGGDTPDPDAATSEPDAALDPPAEPPTCDAACDDIAECLVSQCDGFGEGVVGQLATRCVDACTPEVAAGFADRTCEENVAVLRTRDPNVEAACAPSEPPDPPVDGDGVAALYIGHSFGRPFAEQFTAFAANAGIEGHTQRIVFSGGASGAPQALWENQARRREIQAVLDEGDVELLTMICCSEDFLEDGSDQAIRDWMDYAIAQNPDTRFALAAPWPDFPANYPSVAEFGGLWETLYAAWMDLIVELRADYPDVEIFPIPHGRAAVELRARFEMDALPEVTVMTGRGGDSIFTDEKGHAAPIMLDLGTLVWLGAIYGVDVSTYAFDPPYETDLGAIAADILEEWGDRP